MKRVIPLFLIVFISFFGYSSLLSVLAPFFSSDLSPLNQAVHLTYKQQNILAGVFLALYPLGQFLGSPVIGALSDRYGRKKILIVSLILSCLCFSLIGLAVFKLNLWLLGISCFLAGLGESNMAIALGVAADVSEPEERSKTFGMIWATCSIGYILGAFVGGSLASQFGFYLSFYIISFFVFIATIIVFCLFVDPNQVINKNIKLIDSFMNVLNIFQKTSLRPLYFLNFLYYFCVFGVLRTVLIFSAQKWHIQVGMISMINLYSSAVAFLANFLLFPILIKKFSMDGLIFCIGILLGLSCIFIMIPTEFYFVWLTVGLVAVFAPMLVAALSSYLSIHTQENVQGSVMGNNQSLQVAAEALSATLGGFLMNVSVGLPFVLFGVVALISSLFFGKIMQRQKSLTSLNGRN